MGYNKAGLFWLGTLISVFFYFCSQGTLATQGTFRWCLMNRNFTKTSFSLLRR